MNIRELLTNLGVEFKEAGEHHHTREGWIQIHCPFCGSNNYHLGIHLSGRFASCWRCSGKSIFAVLEKLGVPRKDILNLQRSAVPEARPRTGLKEPPGRGPLLPAHVRYLRERGFDPAELVRLWQIEGIGLAARLKWRIYIPIIHKGQRVSWTTRAIGDAVARRYISAGPDEEAIAHKKILFGLDYVLHSVVIVEGPFDVFAVGPGAVATFGLAFTSAQTLALARVPYRFVCFDSSKDAQLRARSLSSLLSCMPGSTTIVQLDAEDPGSATQKELKRLRRAARLE